MFPPSRSDSTAETTPHDVFHLSPELAQEMRDAVADIERGDCFELMPEQLKEWAETGTLRALNQRA